MITRDQIDELSPNEKLELMQLIWESFASRPETLSVSEREKQELRKRSQAHHSDPASSLSEKEFTTRLNDRLGRST
jgi:putative addiction module component (TIGR02574 family)